MDWGLKVFPWLVFITSLHVAAAELILDGLADYPANITDNIIITNEFNLTQSPWIASVVDMPITITLSGRDSCPDPVNWYCYSQRASKGVFDLY